MTLYAVEGLDVTIDGQRLIDGIGFEVSAGGCTALVGASGSGKSLSCFAPFGLVRGAVVQGSARITGEPLIGRDPARLRQLRRRVGFVLQQPQTALTPHFRVGNLLAESIRATGAGKPDRRALTALLDRVGLADAAGKLDRYPHQLSGGERQRVLVAAAIAHGPQLLIADEPTSALDAHLRRGLLALFDRLRDGGMGLLLVSHDLPLVARHADRLVVLEAGRVVERGSTAEILRHPTSEMTRALIVASPSLDVPVQPSVTSEAVLIEARDIGVAYPGSGWRRTMTDVVRGASLTIHAGEGVAIVGASGSGKSTLARAIARIGPMPQGTVHWQGKPLPVRGRMTIAERGRMQPVFQDPVSSLDPQWRVARSIAEPLDHLRPGLSRAERDTLVDRVMAAVGLSSAFRDRYPASLSGGQAQRVAIARALIAEPALLVLDEASSGLDVLVAARITDMLARLQRERGLALLVVTHDLSLAARLCGRIVVLDQGRIVEEGPAASLLTRPAHPVTKRLVAAAS